MFQHTVYALITTATTTPTAPAPFSISELLQEQVLQFGLLGIVFLCLIFRKFVVPEWTLKAAEERATSEKDDLMRRYTETREQLDKLQDVFQDQMIPALTKATEINARYTEELQKARYVRKDPSEPPQ
jgi:hypothetical protein